jgi:hypothetical protein
MAKPVTVWSGKNEQQANSTTFTMYQNRDMMKQDTIIWDTRSKQKLTDTRTSSIPNNNNKCRENDVGEGIFITAMCRW